MRLPSFVFEMIAALPKLMALARGLAWCLLIRLAGGQCGWGLRLERGCRFRYRLHPGIRLGHRVCMGRDTCIDCPPGGFLSIGDRNRLTQGVFISAIGHVEIGADVLIGEYVSLRDANHGFDRADLPIRSQTMQPQPIIVGDDVWIGRGAAILAGANIGRGSIIGANSVVTGVVPPGMIAAGSPARILRSRFEAAKSG